MCENVLNKRVGITVLKMAITVITLFGSGEYYNTSE